MEVRDYERSGLRAAGSRDVDVTGRRGPGQRPASTLDDSPSTVVFEAMMAFAQAGEVVGPGWSASCVIVGVVDLADSRGSGAAGEPTCAVAAWIQRRRAALGYRSRSFWRGGRGPGIRGAFPALDWCVGRPARCWRVLVDVTCRLERDRGNEMSRSRWMTASLEPVGISSSSRRRCRPNSGHWRAPDSGR
jgi:hypothetical protein